ncbi:hypothetical protein OPV22_011688 [Ensete ventricosum]|uniref:Uncharacterized protein n=1 Tax=Ensete ventricosum TaxID=4639 RepID=A0AAV8RE22_ENSVE|nr:hypothetical protein OPV22_011688 [Ensete ventricosum]
MYAKPIDAKLRRCAVLSSDRPLDFLSLRHQLFSSQRAILLLGSVVELLSFFICSGSGSRGLDEIFGAGFFVCHPKLRVFLGFCELD